MDIASLALDFDEAKKAVEPPGKGGIASCGLDVFSEQTFGPFSNKMRFDPLGVNIIK